MTASHADNHDLDKLARWYDALSTCEVSRFPVHAIFLASAEDKTAHDIFRRFRTSFEAHGAHLGHLVIFGQHGVSSSVRELLLRFGLHTEAIPVLVLFTRPSSTMVYLLPLPGGNMRIDDSRLMYLLAELERIADSEKHALDLTAATDSDPQQISGQSVVDLAGTVLQFLKSPS